MQALNITYIPYSEDEKRVHAALADFDNAIDLHEAEALLDQVLGAESRATEGDQVDSVYGIVHIHRLIVRHSPPSQE